MIYIFGHTAQLHSRWRSCIGTLLLLLQLLDVQIFSRILITEFVEANL